MLWILWFLSLSFLMHIILDVVTLPLSLFFSLSSQLYLPFVCICWVSGLFCNLFPVIHTTLTACIEYIHVFFVVFFLMVFDFISLPSRSWLLRHPSIHRTETFSHSWFLKPARDAAKKNNLSADIRKRNRNRKRKRISTDIIVSMWLVYILI